MGLGSIVLLATSLGVAMARNYASGSVNVLGGLLAGIVLGVLLSIPIIIQVFLVRSRLISWVTGLSVLTICAWIAVALLTGDRVADLYAVTVSMYGVLLLLFLFPIFFVLLFIRPDLIIRLLEFLYLSISILAIAALLLSDARLITAGVPLIVVACLGGIVIDRSLRRRRAA